MSAITSGKIQTAVLRRRTLALAVGAASLLGGSNIALAQQRATALEEVVVTAQQREQSLQDVPIAISAFSTETIERNKFDDVGDYMIRTPNASFTSNGARSRRSISIRGVTDFLPGNRPLAATTFGFYVDGFNLATSNINPPILDVERIEVLRGPQATFFGGNAIGGGLNITSVQPDSTAWGGSAVLDYSSFDTRDFEGILNVPIIEGVLAARLNAKVLRSDGNIENINPIGGGNDAEYDYFKGNVLWTPNEDLSVLVSVIDADETVGMREGVPSGVFSPFAQNALFAGFPDRDGDGRPDADPDGVGFYPENDDRVNFNFPQEVGTEVQYVVGRVDYDFSNMTFTSITGYMESDFFLAGDIDGGSRDFFNEFRNITRESFTQEFRLQSAGESKLTWSLGFYYADLEGEIDNKTRVGNEEPFGIPEGNLVDSAEEINTAESTAVFGQLDYQLTDRLSLSVGGRYSEEKLTFDGSGFSGAVLEELTAEDKFTDFSPRFAFNYDLTDESTLYGTISKGFKSGGVQQSPIRDLQSYDPEELWNYEVGIKADLLDRRLRISAAAFYMDWTDLQSSFQQAGRDDDGNLVLFGGVDNAEQAYSQGLEFSFTALPTEGLTLNGAIGYLEAEFEEFTAFITGQNRNLDNETIPNSPEWTASFDADYRFPLSASLEGFVRVEWAYRDEIITNTEQFIQFRESGEKFPFIVPSYDFWNIRAGIQADNYTITAYAENAFDDKFYTNAYSKAFMGGLHVEPSRQVFGIRGRYEF